MKLSKVITIVLLSFISIGVVYGVSANDSSSAKIGNQYYIDNFNGNDSNNGNSQEKAWKTMSRIEEEVFQPGDEILFKRGGVWTGSLNPKGSGSSKRSIIISAYGNGNRPIINGNGVENVIKLKNQQYWEISNLEITNFVNGEIPAEARRGIHIVNENYGGENLSESNISTITELKGFYIHDMYIHDVLGQDRKDTYGSSGIQFTVHIPKNKSINQRTTFNGIKIENNILKNVQRSGIILISDWSSRDLVEDIDNNKSIRPWTPILNVHIRGNKLYNMGGDGIVPHMTDGAIIEYNFINGYNTMSTGANAGMWVYNGDNALFQYNEVTGGKSTRDGMPWDFDHGSQGVTYQFNYSYNNEGGTLLLCADVVGKGVRNGIFRYNLSYNDSHQTFTVCKGDNVSNINIYNNIFYLGKNMNTNPSVEQGGKARVNIFNNIFVNNGRGKYEGKSSFNYSNNVYSGANIKGLNTINEPHKIIAEPMFKDKSHPDVLFPGTVLNKDILTRDVTDWSALNGFMLSENSPAINSGRFVTLDTDNYPNKHDIFGNLLYNGMPDVGIHEYIDNNTTP
ncbi:hypothetical protein [Vibrio hepatarius]|uniref:hypothetical protein n=1 Tax=Vibrio hepatarius TaxID=171383 RepID=UPI00142D1C80|nr:hypothetical protein [Vibrio hepatarius]NIY83710.1 hypothetical protein [Vibrio hepatarius]